MDIDKESQQKLQELQILEQSMNNILMQKQGFQLELNETINALEEVRKSEETIYKMVGSIMVKADPKKTLEDLEEKKKVLELRNSSLGKQEQLLETKAKELQEVLKKDFENKESEKKN